MGRCPKPCQRDLSLWTPAFDWIENEAAPVFVIGSGFSYGAPHNKSFEQTFSPRRARLRIAKAASYAMHHRKPNTLNARQNKSFDQTFSKVCRFPKGGALWSLVATSETPPAFKRSRAWVPASEAPIQNSIAQRYLILFYRSKPSF